MEPRVLLDALIESAREAGFSLHRLAASDHEAPTHSGVGRLRDRTIVLLVESDTIEDRIDVVAGALAALGADWLDARFLPPAVRRRIEDRLRSA